MELYTVCILAFWQEHSIRAHEVEKCGEPRLCPGELVAGLSGPGKKGSTTSIPGYILSTNIACEVHDHSKDLLVTSDCVGGRAGSEQP